MRLGGVCITTNDAPRLAEFYKIVFQKEPFIEGSHYGFWNLAVYNPGNVESAREKAYGCNALTRISTPCIRGYYVIFPTWR